MISLTETVLVEGPLEEVWPLLRNPEVVASCIPGAELSADSTDDVWRGRIKVKFGPTAAAFRGEAALAFDDEAKRCRINGRGIDQRGASRASSTLEIQAVAAGPFETNLNIDGQFNVTGPLGAFASTGGVHVARILLGEFAANLSARVVPVASRAPGAVGEAEPASPRAGAREKAELSGLSLFGRLLAGWFRSLFRKRNV